MKQSIHIILVIAATLLMAGCIHTPQDTTPQQEQPEPDQQQSTLPTSVELGYILLEDAGQQGQQIGCNDSYVTSTVTPPANITTRPALITWSYTKLFQQNSMQPGWTTALPTTGLQVTNVTLSGQNNQHVTVALSGTLLLGGTCDNPRVDAQLTNLIDQFSQFTTTSITINGEPVDSYLSLQ